MRSILIVLLVLAGVGSGLAQTKTYVGVTAGGHSYSAYFRHTIFRSGIRTSFQYGSHAGILIKHFPRKRDIFFNAGIQGGVNYVQKGWAQRYSDEIGLPNYNVSMNYIEIPVEGIGYFGKKNKYYVGAGLYSEILLDYKKDPTPQLPENIDFVTYEEERDREIGYGGRISGGIFRDFSFGSLHIEGFFNYSFSNFIDAGDLTDDQLPDVSNLWTTGVSIGYLISFGKLEMVE